MSIVKFALGTAACALVPALLLGAALGAVFDRIERRRDWQQQWDNLVNEAESWLSMLDSDDATPTEGKPA